MQRPTLTEVDVYDPGRIEDSCESKIWPYESLSQESFTLLVAEIIETLHKVDESGDVMYVTCPVRGPKHSGKSRYIYSLAEALAQQGIALSLIDLTKIPTPIVNPETYSELRFWILQQAMAQAELGSFNTYALPNFEEAGRYRAFFPISSSLLLYPRLVIFEGNTKPTDLGLLNITPVTHFNVNAPLLTPKLVQGGLTGWPFLDEHVVAEDFSPFSFLEIILAEILVFFIPPLVPKVNLETNTRYLENSIYT